MKKQTTFRRILVVLVMLLLIRSGGITANAGTVNKTKYNAYEKRLIAAIESGQTSVDVSDLGISEAEIAPFITMFIHGNPRYFYCHPYNFYYTPGHEGMWIQMLDYIPQAQEKKAAYEKKVAAILKQTGKKWSDFEKVVFIHDYLALNASYGEAGKAKQHAHDAYGVLVNGKGVCQSYAAAFQDLMDRLGVPCETVQSDQLNHVWNVVKVGGSWYEVDVTWDDPVPDTKGAARHNFLLKSHKWMVKQGRHKATDYLVSGGLTLSKVAKSTRFDRYDWNNTTLPYQYFNGKWYSGAERETGEVAYYKYDKKTKQFEKKGIQFTIADKWNMWKNAENVYPNCYSSTYLHNGKFYYSTKDEIRAYDLKKKTTKTIHKADTSKGYIYSFTVKDGKLTYLLQQEYYTKVKKRVTIKL